MNFAIPMTGKLITLDQIPDEAFSQKTLGDGFAIALTGEVVISPISGIVIAAFPIGHAFIIRKDDGLEVLIHVGLNSANKPNAFRMQVEKYQRIKQGDVLVYVDKTQLGETEADFISPVVFSNTNIQLGINKVNQFVQVGDTEAVSVSLT